jgi:beta-galactosidase
MTVKTIAAIFAAALILFSSMEGQTPQQPPRERLLMDAGWRFALGHAYDTNRDFAHGSGYFSYFAKAGYGDGPASKDFDDRAWRTLSLPHDWCVELPFDEHGSYSHGYKAMGRNFPENSVGWYRRKFFVPASDNGKRLTIEFDGVFRNSRVWVNGFYCGTEESGYAGFAYDVSEYLNYGGENVVAVRVDATMEEGWYYEGAGMYRHVWLTKCSPLHIAADDTFITTDLQKNSAAITTRITVANESSLPAEFTIDETIIDTAGTIRTSSSQRMLSLRAGERREYRSRFTISDPAVWSLETPSLHQLHTTISSGGAIVDAQETTFGIRTVRFDADSGFFLNGMHVKILGTNIHQDHAGVGIALPDALQEFRIRQLKQLGSNAIRTAHHPPSPALLDACDRLGMLVLDENRLMGVNEEHLASLGTFMKRDRNHPSVILWSLGNEEWAIEGNQLGARIASAMQAFAQRLDSSRAVTAAVSGGWDTGTGMVLQVMGYNYIVQGNIDGHHAKFPLQAGIGTEETTTGGTRGIYSTDNARAHMAPTNRMPENVGTESGWQFYAARPFLAGLFYWTGFDYRGEMHPYDWPAISSQFGLLDVCGFPKDGAFYLKSWWGTEHVLHIVPDWNGTGGNGAMTNVTVYSNCEQVDLSLNGRSVGRKDMPRNGHLEWRIPYQPGVLTSRGYVGQQLVLTDSVGPIGIASAIQLLPDRGDIRADGTDVSVITVQIVDAHGVAARTDSSELTFTLDGPGKIIGVGNGDPSSHEPDRFVDRVNSVPIGGLKEFTVSDLTHRPETAAGYNDSTWKPALRSLRTSDWRAYTDTLLVIRGTFEVSELTNETDITLYSKSIVENQSIYVNGRLIAADIVRGAPGQAFTLDRGLLHAGKNVYAVTGRRFRKKYQWDEPNTDPGVVQFVVHPPRWHRKAFNGLAQVLVQSELQPGELTLTASAAGLRQGELRLHTMPAAPQPAVSIQR